MRDLDARKLVLFPEVDASRVAAIREAGGELEVVNCANQEQASAAIVDADAFFGKITPDLLARAGRLRWVQSATASLEHYVFPELIAHPCRLTNMRGLFHDVIADHVMGYVLSFARHFPYYIRCQLQKRWAPRGGESQRSNFAGGPCFVSGMDRAHLHLSDCTLGIVGLGSIGAEVARRALAFGMRVLAVDPVTQVAPPGVAALWTLDGLDRLLADSDFVVICAPHTPRTAGMFDRELLRRMRRSAYLINIGRGAIVKLDDLVEALRAGEIAGAALDVFEIEPLPAEHPLWDFDNVILTPHVAACSIHIAERHLATLLENVRRYVAGEPLMNVVNKAEWS
ncbi:MAG: D-2-hydroxyacid dehydrogenase [Pirellulales bacterium]